MCDRYHDFLPLGCAVCGREICFGCSGDFRQRIDGEFFAVCKTCRITRQAEVELVGCASRPVSNETTRLVAGLTAGA